jgi:protein-S-isoprenylcysteine O-methyltransferase Ste14
MLIFAAGPLGLLSWLPRLAGQAIVVVALAASSVASVLLAASRDGWSAPRMAGMLGVVLLVACVYVLVIVWSSNGMLGF